MEIRQLSENAIEVIQELNELPVDKLIWIDASSQEVQEVVKKVEQLTGQMIYETHIEDCLNLQHPCFYDTTQIYDLLIFRCLVSDNPENYTETSPIDFLIFMNILVTFSSHDSAIQRIKKRLEVTRKKIPTGTMALSFLLLDEIVDNFLDLRKNLLEKFSYWQQELFLESKQSVDWIAFLNFKTEIRKLRILSEDQLEVIYQWRQDNEVGLNDLSIIQFNDLSDHIHRIIRYTTQLENDLETLIQLHYSLIGNRTNDVMRVLTVLSAIFLPLNLIAGIFGMNFANMRIFQLPYGQNIALLIMAFLATLLFFIFKWKKWI